MMAYRICSFVERGEQGFDHSVSHSGMTPVEYGSGGCWCAISSEGERGDR